MPLSPLPEDNTKRYKMLYTVGPQTHTFTVRTSSSMTDATANTHFLSLWAAIGSSVSTGSTWGDLLVAAQGSNVFNSTGTWTPVTGGGSGISPINYPRSLCFPGRANSGRKTKLFLYGIGDGFTTPGSYEEDPLVTATFQGFQGVLDTTTDFALAIDGTKGTWYFRVTIKPNDHWVDSVR